MARVRKNYILFKSDGKGPVIAGSFSSFKRAREAIKEDAVREVGRQKTVNGFSPNIEYAPDGGRLRIRKNKNVDYKIRVLFEDRLSPIE